MDWGFFQELLRIDSTSGKERKVAEWLAERLPGMFPAANRPELRAEEVGDGTLNLLLTWGAPRIVFCSHPPHRLLLASGYGSTVYPSHFS